VEVRGNHVLIKSGKVHYSKPVSDIELQLIIKRIAECGGTTITVHSGDRDFRAKGSPKKSLHLHHRAADVHASGLTDTDLFELLRAKKDEIFNSVVHRYQVIHHGKFTETEGEHVHIGDYHQIKALVVGLGVSFFVEGMSPATKGKYDLVPA
jgi:hypothetical protein